MRSVTRVMFGQPSFEIACDSNIPVLLVGGFQDVDEGHELSIARLRSSLRSNFAAAFGLWRNGQLRRSPAEGGTKPNGAPF